MRKEFNLFNNIFSYLILLINSGEFNLYVIDTPSTYDAQVAVLDCSKQYPNLYYDLEKKDWAIYSDSNCLKNGQEILSFCQKIYPNLQVVNIMRLQDPIKFTIFGCKNKNDSKKAQENIRINNQMNADKSKICSKIDTESIQPYKCLYGAYLSNELYIPSKCRFQHLYSNDGCRSQEHWDLLSVEKCKTTNSVLNSSMLLQWCKADTNGLFSFRGIEFVCCPENLQNKLPKNDLEDEDIDDENNYDYDDYNKIDYNSVNKDTNESSGTEPSYSNLKLDISQETNKKEMKNKIDLNTSNSKYIWNKYSTKKITNTVFYIDNAQEEVYDREAIEGTTSEKGYYEKEKNQIINTIKLSVDQLEKDLEQERKSFGLNIQEKMSQILNEKYKKRFDNLNEEKLSLLRQMEQVYDKKILNRLINNRDQFASKLNSLIKKDVNRENIESIIFSLYNYCAAQERIRLHIVNIYNKLKTRYSLELKEKSQLIKNHLESIDRNLSLVISNIGMKYLSKSKKVFDQLKEHLKRYENVQNSSLEIIKELSRPEENTNDFLDSDNLNNYIDSSDDEKSPNLITDSLDDSNYKLSDYYDDSSRSDSNLINENFNVNPGNIVENDVEKKIKLLNENQSNVNLIKIFVIIGGLLSAFFVIVLVSKLVTQKNFIYKKTVNHGFVPINTNSPEDIHIGKMQMNGYENPTYKYFENNIHA